MAEKDKVGKTRDGNSDAVAGEGSFGSITSKQDLKTFLLSVRDKMAEEIAPAIYCMSAMNFLFNHNGIYELMDEETRELSRDIWLRLKNAGLQVRQPPFLFSDDGTGAPLP